MQKNTVKRRIFLTNIGMIAAVLLLFLLINIVVVKVYGEMIEHPFKASLQQMSEQKVFDLEQILKEYTVRRNSFYLLLIADVIVCIAGLVLIGTVFTKRLSERIDQPLTALTKAAERIQSGDYSTDINYEGEEEFETACCSFNMMQHSILEEQEKVRQYEKARTDMIAGISHDLRTPLTAIRGTVKGLLDGVAHTEQQQTKFLQTAYRRTGEMNELLERLFFFSKLETGNMPIQFVDLKIMAFLEEYVEVKKEVLQSERRNDGKSGQPDIRLEIERSGDATDRDKDDKTRFRDLVCRLDPGQMVRILDNLVENSRKYAQADPLHMVISVRKDGQKVMMSFRDNGVGMEESKLPFIFDEFYRGDESRGGRDGNGLGLYIVKYLTMQMQGEISAYNEVGLRIDMTFPMETGGERR